MAIQSLSHADMLKAMKDVEVSNIVKRLLGPSAKHLKTWGHVDAFMQKEQQMRRCRPFKTDQGTADKLLHKLRVAYVKNEAKKRQ